MVILEKAHIFAPSNKNNDNFRSPKITRISKLQPNNSDKTYLMETGGLTSPVSFFILPPSIQHIILKQES